MPTAVSPYIHTHTRRHISNKERPRYTSKEEKQAYIQCVHPARTALNRNPIYPWKSFLKIEEKKNFKFSTHSNDPSCQNCRLARRRRPRSHGRGPRRWNNRSHCRCRCCGCLGCSNFAFGRISDRAFDFANSSPIIVYI